MVMVISAKNGDLWGFGNEMRYIPTPLAVVVIELVVVLVVVVVVVLAVTLKPRPRFPGPRWLGVS